MLVIRRLVLLLFLSTGAFCANLTGTFSTCSDCPDNAICLPPSDPEPSSQAVTCSCREGFVGSGPSCYNIKECSSSLRCCAPGQQWSSQDGCADVDQCAGREETCPSPYVCENAAGSFHCLARGDRQRSARSVTFMCSGQMCPAGQDCLQINGSSHCADPCRHYAVLNEPWRATNYTDGTFRCDSNLNGWFRFLGPAGVQMPESCVPTHKCGTHAPVWLNGAHPQPEDGVVSRETCGHWTGGCCNFRHPVHVKACPGGYFVYKIQSTNGCSLVYCADVNTAVCASCKEYETCRSDDKGKWSCECEDSKANDEMSDLTPELQCEPNLIQIGLMKCQLEARGLNTSSAHLANSSCRGHGEQGGMAWLTMGRREGECGTNLTTNGTHAIYTNALSIQGKMVGNVFLVPRVSIPFSCAYPLDLKTSLEVAVKPIKTTVELRVSGLGWTRATMSLYRNSSYTEPYPAGEVNLPLMAPLFVGVFVEDIKEDRFAVVLEDCYATPSEDALDPVHFFLIQNRCPIELASVVVPENGVSLQALFSAKLFRFIGNYDTVFLHCAITVCDSTMASCKPSCPAKRSASVPFIDILTIGPVQRSQEPPKQSSASAGTAGPWVIFSGLIQVLLLHKL
ncbi:uromodulin-like [Lepisosteus oculatus]|uniref:uromodulin-like n=1 Tax=Lepisosteus oculatus TaxID=7918 RepID=UPI0035F525E7